MDEHFLMYVPLCYPVQGRKSRKGGRIIRKMPNVHNGSGRRDYYKAKIHYHAFKGNFKVTGEGVGVGVAISIGKPYKIE